jgi:signal transduction histidine kinase
MKLSFFTRLSDKILLAIFIFSSVLLVLIIFVFKSFVYQIVIIGTMIYILAFLTTYIISRRFSKRIIDMIFRVEEIAAGNFSKRLETKSRDEIGQLANALNELMARLQTQVAIDVSKNVEIAQAKTDFTTIASHQLRTPLSIIKWYLDYVIVGDAGTINEEQKKYLIEVYQNNEKLIELVNALLDVSRIEMGNFAIEPELTDIIKITESVLSKFYPEIEKKKIIFEKKYDDFPRLNLDPSLIRIVFENIISNAIKYTSEGGCVNLIIKKTDKNVLIEISDNGCGIPRSAQPQIFSKLYRADNAKRIEASGTGLGLYIIKSIVEKSGGKIWFESPNINILLDSKITNKEYSLANNAGTTFYISIPLKGMKAITGTKKLTSI